MPDMHYTHPRLVELYDLDSPWGADTEFYISLAGTRSESVLDLGCGTGTLCNALARLGHDVTGVDPAAEMLRVARTKPHAGAIQWIQSTAQGYRSDKRFNLIVMTGHAFQVLLTDDDVVAVFETMRHHLQDDGVIAFESRNPRVDWATEWPRRFVWQLEHGTVQQSRSELSISGQLIGFSHTFRFPDQTLVSESTLRFMGHDEIAALLRQSGFRVVDVFGDWDRKPFDSHTSKEMIFVAKAAS